MVTLANIFCDTCDDLGVLLAPTNDGRQVTVACPDCEAGYEKREAMTQRAFRLARIPVGYEHFTFQSFHDLCLMNGKRLAFAAAYEFASRRGGYFRLDELGIGTRPGWDVPRNSLILTGDNGIGKTGLAVAAVRALTACNVRVLYIRAGDMIRELQDTYDGSYDGPRLAEKLHLLKSEAVLVIDEFEVNNYTADRLDLIEIVIRGRYSNNLPTMATTNLTAEQFLNVWGRRTGDAMLTGHWVAMGGIKLRKTIQEAEHD